MYWLSAITIGPVLTSIHSSLQTWVIRIPNFVKLDPKPFHPDTYAGPEQSEEFSQSKSNAREKSMSIKLEVANTIRWRWGKDEFDDDVCVPLPISRQFTDVTLHRNANQTVELYAGLTAHSVYC